MLLFFYMQGADLSREPQSFDQMPVPTDSPPQQPPTANHTLSSVRTLGQFGEKNSNEHATTRTLAPPRGSDFRAVREMHGPIVGEYSVDDRILVERTMRCAELQGKLAAAAPPG